MVTQTPLGSAKVPLKVAVFADPALTIHEPLGFYEKMNPALANTIRDALAADFETVEVVNNRPSAADANLLAIPSTDGIFGKETLSLTVTFVDPQSGKSIAVASSTDHLDEDAAGANDHKGADAAIIGSTLVFPPAIILSAPILQHHDADRFNAAFGPALIAMATDIAARASKDPAIRSLSVH